MPLSHQRGSRAGSELELEKHWFFPFHTAAEPPLSSRIRGVTKHQKVVGLESKHCIRHAYVGGGGGINL